jgi:hypothetical protein
MHLLARNAIELDAFLEIDGETEAASAYSFDRDFTGGILTVTVISELPITLGPIAIEVLGGSNLVFSWEGEVGKTYALQSRTNLLEGTWESVTTNITGAENISITNGDLSEAESFYQAIIE